MRHRKAGRKLSRTSSHRRALLRSLVTSLVEHGGVRTTDAKAKEARRYADRMVTYAKRNTLHTRRRALRFIRSRAVVQHLFNEIGPRYRDRPGGYSRIIKLGPRPGDRAAMVLLELVPGEEEKQAKEKKKGAVKRRSRTGGRAAAKEEEGKQKKGRKKSEAASESKATKSKKTKNK